MWGLWLSPQSTLVSSLHNIYYTDFRFQWHAVTIFLVWQLP